MRTLSLPLALLLAGCGGDPYEVGDDTAGDGVPQCSRVRGTEALLMYQDEGATLRSPYDPANAADAATGVAGPLGDDRTYVLVGNGGALVSLDGGCTWDEQGALADGDWRLRAAGSRVYAFDMASATGAVSDDLGLSWTPFDSVEPFVGVPVVDAAAPDRLRGLQARGVVTSNDGGDTWAVSGDLPPGLDGAADADLLAADLDVAVVAGAGGAWRTDNGGTSWAPILADGAVSAVALHPDDGGVVFAVQTDAEDRTTLLRSEDAGVTWARQVDTTQVPLSGEPELWPVPGDPTQVLASFGPVFNEDVDGDGLNLYLVTAGVGTRTFFVATWFHLHQFAFGSDRWLAAVDALPSR